MNPYENVLSYCAKTLAYTRGEFKGDYPLHKRRKRYDRIQVRTDNIIIVRYAAPLFTIYPDGSFKMDLCGWGLSPTTREAVGWGFYRMGMRDGDIYSARKYGVSQVFVRTPAGTWPYKDGMEFDANGQLLSEAPTLQAKRINKEKSKTFRAAIKASGFKDMFPLLFATMPVPTERPKYPYIVPLADLLASNEYAEHWQTIIQAHSFEQRWMTGGVAFARKVIERRNPETGRYEEYPYTAQHCWNNIMRKVKAAMQEVVKL